MGFFDRFSRGKAADTLSPAEAKQMMDAGAATVLDVREPDEYAGGHIPGAALLPLSEVRAMAPSLLPDRDAPVLVYCQSGPRATTACGILQKLGYTKVYNLGGIAQWPYEIED